MFMALIPTNPRPSLDPIRLPFFRRSLVLPPLGKVHSPEQRAVAEEVKGLKPNVGSFRGKRLPVIARAMLLFVMVKW